MAPMLFVPLLVAMVFLVIFWCIRETFTLLVFNFALIFIIVDFTSYFSMTDVTSDAQLHMIYLFVTVAIIGWTKTLYHLVINYRKGLMLIQEGDVR